MGQGVDAAWRNPWSQLQLTYMLMSYIHSLGSGNSVAILAQAICASRRGQWSECRTEARSCPSKMSVPWPRVVEALVLLYSAIQIIWRWPSRESCEFFQCCTEILRSCILNMVRVQMQGRRGYIHSCVSFPNDAPKSLPLNHQY